MTTLAPSALNQLLTTQPGLPVLDVRTPAEFGELHVPQAQNFPIERFNAQALLDSGKMNPTEPVYLLCHAGTRAKIAAEKLAQVGFTQTVVIEGGTAAWEQAGLPVTRGESRVISLERQVRIAAGTLVLSGVLLSLFVEPKFIFLSGFVGAGLIFAGITDFCGMGLLLARMPWNQRG